MFVTVPIILFEGSNRKQERVCAPKSLQSKYKAQEMVARERETEDAIQHDYMDKNRAKYLL